MLGDQLSSTAPSATTPFDDVIQSPEALRFDGPYILISAGPDGPNRLNGGYCNFANIITGAATEGQLADPNSGATLLPSQLLQMFIASGNVYNFDHP